MLATIRWLAAAALAALPIGSVSGASASGSPRAEAPVPEAADSGLIFVPAQAPVVVHLRGVERTKERLTAVLNKAVPDFGPLAAGYLDGLLQTGLEGRQLKGLVKDGQVFLALLELPAANVDI